MSVPCPSSWTAQQRRALVRALLRWFGAQARDLPWRRTRDPYAIWIAEVMLQQTRVATVLPYWERWMRHLPDVAAVARAKPDRLRKLWEGLGYYRRVEHLQAAARRILQQHGGRFPERFEDVLALPGVGRYTAGAICSAAFNQPTPAVDGNVARVLGRMLGRALDASGAVAWTAARRLVECAAVFPPVRLERCSTASPVSGPIECPPCSALNQGLMELGATVCTPRQPRCPECPWRRFCVSRHDPTALRRSHSKRPDLEERHLRVWLVQQGSRWLLRLRPRDGVNGGFWEFPTVEIPRASPRSNPAPADPIDGKFEAAAAEPLLCLTHHITRYRYRVEVWTGRLCRPWPEGHWLTRRQLQMRPLTRLTQKVLECLPQDGAESPPDSSVPKRSAGKTREKACVRPGRSA